MSSSKACEGRKSSALWSKASGAVAGARGGMVDSEDPFKDFGLYSKKNRMPRDGFQCDLMPSLRSGCSERNELDETT